MALPPACRFPERRDLSPNGKWVTFVCLGEGNPGEHSLTKVKSINGSAEWKLVYGKTIGTNKLRSYGNIYPFHWSIDGRYLYLAHSQDGDGVWSFNNGDGLLRLDLLSGKVTEVLQYAWYSFSISPKDDLLVYVYNHIDTLGKPLSIRFLNLITGEKKSIEIEPKFLEAGDFIWSPDQMKLIFSAAEGELGDEQLALLEINLESLGSKILMDTLPKGIVLTEIRSDGAIILGDYSQMKVRYFELIEGKLVSIP